MAYLLRNINQVSLAETLNVCLFIKVIQFVPNDANPHPGRSLSFLPSWSAVFCADCCSRVLLPKSCNKTIRQGGISWDCAILKPPVISEGACQYSGFPRQQVNVAVPLMGLLVSLPEFRKPIQAAPATHIVVV